MDTPYELSSDEEALYNMDDADFDAALKEARTAPTEVVEEITEEVIIDEPIEDIVDENLEHPELDSEIDNQEGNIEEEVVIDGEEPTDELDEVPVDNPEPETAEPTEKEPVIDTFKIRANGNDFEFTQDELLELAPKAMDYTKKMQEIAPWKKTISALKDNDVTHEDVNLLIDVLKGDKDAITSVIKRAGIDTLDIDTENVAYNPREYGRSEIELAIDDVVDTISRDPEYSVTQHVVNSQWDDASRSKFAQNPNMIRALHDDVKTGIYDAVSPRALKLKVLDGGTKSDVEYYIKAGNAYHAEMNAHKEAQVAQEQVQEAQRVTQEKQAIEQKAIATAKANAQAQKKVSDAANARKAAGSTTKVAGRKDVMDYLDDSDESYDSWYKNLMANV